MDSESVLGFTQHLER